MTKALFLISLAMRIWYPTFHSTNTSHKNQSSSFFNGLKYHSSIILHPSILYYRLGLQCRRVDCSVGSRRLWGSYGRSDSRPREPYRRLRPRKLFRSLCHWKESCWLVVAPELSSWRLEGRREVREGFTQVLRWHRKTKNKYHERNSLGSYMAQISSSSRHIMAFKDMRYTRNHWWQYRRSLHRI